MSAVTVPARGESSALLTALARTVVTLYRTDASTLRLPYPPDVQRCFDRVVWECHVNRKSSPESVAGLMAWCRDWPLGSWPITLTDGSVSPSAVLVDPLSKTPTATCAELASHGPSGVLEQEAWSAFNSCLANCPEAVRPTCRDLLLQHTVVDSSVYFAVSLRPQTAQAWDYVAKLYKPAPRDFVVNKKIATCNECGMLAMPSMKRPLWCESETCRRSSEFKLHEPTTVQVLDYPLRAFVAKAGRTELAVRQKLTERGFPLSPIPSSDAYRVEGPGGVWTMRVHSRAEPLLHAAQVAAMPAGEAERLLIVMAAEVLGGRPGYAKTFRRALPAGSDVTLVADRQLIRLLSSDARRRDGKHDA